jgi:GNAT superfamily N-acetyltransferase
MTLTTTPNGLELRFLHDPAEFLELAGEHLAAEPVVSTVVATVAHRAAATAADGTKPRDPDWWLVVTDRTGQVVGAGMRTAPFAPYPLFLLPMPAEAAIALARILHERGEETSAINGALPTVRQVADELVRLEGGTIEVSLRTRLFEVTEVTAPAPRPGKLIAATEEDVDLVISWFEAFMGDADEQAGRPRGSSPHEGPERTSMLRRIETGSVWFWVDEAGQKVHLTAANPPSFGVARVGPVYTPPERRGQGWASSAVAEVSRRLLAEGARVCLFTDQANPTSNRIYTALGYRPVVDMVNLVIVR